MSKAAFFAVLSAALTTSVSAQDGYRHTQDNSADASASVSSGPVRMARVAFLSGSISWRPDETVDWSTGAPNIPLRQGAEIWVGSGSRADVQFDDGSRLHLGSNAIACLETMFSDSRGEFTEIRLNSGLASLTLTNKESMYQVDTPLLSTKAYGSSKVRIGIGNDVEVAVRHGEARVEDSQGPATLESGQYVDVADEASAYQVLSLPPSDDWDRYTDERDFRYDHPSQYIPSNIGSVCGDMEGYGSWRSDPNYGHVWYPTVPSRAWRPYHDGHWVWVDPFGWTWVADEPWGWAPYHYGAWVHSGLGWGWVPGPRHQYWAPAVVSFSVYNGAVAWVPLAPSEVAYPPVFSAGVSLGWFGLGFSIGGACCYYPTGPSYVASRPWRNSYANRVSGAFDASRVNTMFTGHIHVGGNRFLPLYGHSAFAITRTTAGGFLSRGKFQSGTSSDPTIFTRGHEMTVSAGHTPVFSPDNVRPSVASLTPSRAFAAGGPSASALARPVFRAAVPSNVSRTSSPIGRTVGPSQNGSGYRRPISSQTSKYRRPGGHSPISASQGGTERRPSANNLGERASGSTSKYRRSGTQNRVGTERFGTAQSNHPTGVRPGGSHPTGGSHSGPPSRYRNHGGRGHRR